MKIDVAVKIIIALLVVMIVSLVSVIVLMDGDGKDEKEPTKITSSEDEGTSDEGTTPPDTSTSTPDTSEPDTSVPDTSVPDTSVPDTSETDTSTPDTSEPDTSEPDGDELPDDFLVKTTLKSDTGTKLNLVADVTAYEDNGRVKVIIEISLEHYSLTVRSKTGSLVVGDETVVFSADAISYSGSSNTQTVLYTYEGSFDDGQTIDIFIDYPFNGKYGGVEIDDISITGQIILG